MEKIIIDIFYMYMKLSKLIYIFTQLHDKLLQVSNSQILLVRTILYLTVTNVLIFISKHLFLFPCTSKHLSMFYCYILIELGFSVLYPYMIKIGILVIFLKWIFIFKHSYLKYIFYSSVYKYFSAE